MENNFERRLAMKRILLLAIILLIILLNTGCGAPDTSSRLRVTLVTSNVAPSGSTIHAKSVIPGTTDKFFGVARNGYIIMYNEFQVTSLLSEGVEILNETEDADYTWHILSTPSEPTCDTIIGNGINCPYDPTAVGKYRLRVDFHDADGVYPDQSFAGVAIFYSGIWMANPVMVSTTETNGKGYQFNADGTITVVTDKANSDIYLGDPYSTDENCLLARFGIVKVAQSSDDTLSLISFNPDSYSFTTKLNTSGNPSGVFLVKCQNGGFAKLGVFGWGGNEDNQLNQIYGWFEYTSTNEFLNFD
jgi:hypothetical protein